MALKNSSAPAVKRSGSPVRSRAVPSVTVPSHEDLETAKTDALLQLKIGRSAHYYAVIVSAALLIDGFLVLFVQPNIAHGSSQDPRTVFFLAPPLLAGVYLSAFGLRVKWEEYQLWPWEPHFSATVASLGLNVVLLFLYGASVAHYGPTGSWSLLPWFFPLSMFAVALPLVSLALTWPDWTNRKTASVAFALLPVPLAFVLFIPTANPISGDGGAALTLVAGAAMFQTSGSFLHLIASGTRTHERELISSNQGHLFQKADELRQKEVALRFRESTIVQREADADNTETTLVAKAQAAEQLRAHLTTLENDLAQRAATLGQQQKALAIQAADVAAKARAVTDQQENLNLREQDLQGRLPTLGEREAGLRQREGDVAKRTAELEQRSLEVEARLRGIPETEVRLETQRRDIERKTVDLLRRETELSQRGSMAATAVPPAANDLAEREGRMQQLKVTLDEQNVLLGRRKRELDEMTASITRLRDQNAKRAEEVGRKEADVQRREAEARQQLDLARRREQQYTDATKAYETKATDAERRTAELSSTADELSRKANDLKGREGSVKETETRLKVQIDALARRERDLLRRERAADAKEAEAGVQGLASAADDGELGTVTVTARAARLPDRLPTGTPRLDDLLQGGFPPRGHVVLLGDPFVGKEILAYAFLAEGLKRGESAVVVTAARSREEVSQKIGLVSPQFLEYEQHGRVTWVDASRADPGGTIGSAGAGVSGPSDYAGILRAIVAGSKKAEGTGKGAIRVAFLGLSATLAHANDREGVNFLANLVGILKPRDALAMYTLEPGSLSDAMTESVLGRMDGVVRFRAEGDRTYLAVQGIGEVQTREWVEYRATNRALIIGSFALDRIK